MDMLSGKVTGVIGAMEQELALLKGAAQIRRKIVRAGMEFHVGTLGGAEAVIVQCGIGKVNAGLCVQILADEFHVTHVVNTGVAGSLDDRLRIGDIVISADAVQHDYDISPLGFRKGEIPYTGLYAFPADAALRRRALEAAKGAIDASVSVYEGRVCSGDQFISDAAVTARIIREFGGLCCEMEGAAIAQASYLNGLPFVIVRAISDSSDGESPASFEKFTAQAAANCAAIVRGMLK